MDKKGRENKTYTNSSEEINLHEITSHISSQEKCGLISNYHSFHKEYGKGTYQTHIHDGLYIAIFDVSLSKNICIKGGFSDSILELSYLIEGEQIIHIDGIEKELTYENQESYLAYLPKIGGTVYYNNKKHLKEIKIRMNRNFIQKHQLENELMLFNIHSLVEKNFIQLINNTKQEILTKILTNEQQGLSKRLFLESQILQLLSLQINNVTEKNKPNNLLKRLYEVQHIISSNLTIHHSIQELSKLVGLNEFLLKKEFKRVFGKTIFEYLTELKMDKAKELLNYTDKPIYEISEMVGYKNSTHFTAAFKKNQGITPKNYKTTKSKTSH